ITSVFNSVKDESQRRKIDYDRRLKETKAQAERKVPSQPAQKMNPELTRTQPGTINIKNIFQDSKVDAKEIKRTKAEEMFSKGLEKYKKDDIDGAITSFQSAIEHNAKIAKYHSNLGLAMLKKGWNGYAMAEFKVAL